MLTYWIKLLKTSHVRMLFFVSLLFVAVINPYSVFKILNILVSLFFMVYIQARGVHNINHGCIPVRGRIKETASMDI